MGTGADSLASAGHRTCCLSPTVRARKWGGVASASTENAALRAAACVGNAWKMSHPTFGK